MYVSTQIHTVHVYEIVPCILCILQYICMHIHVLYVHVHVHYTYIYTCIYRIISWSYWIMSSYKYILPEDSVISGFSTYVHHSITHNVYTLIALVYTQTCFCLIEYPLMSYAVLFVLLGYIHVQTSMYSYCTWSYSSHHWLLDMGLLQIRGREGEREGGKERGREGEREGGKERVKQLSSSINEVYTFQ